MTDADIGVEPPSPLQNRSQEGSCDVSIGAGRITSDNTVALIAAALTGLSPGQRRTALAEILPAYVLAWHRLCPDMPAQEIARRYSADARAALARLAEEAETPAPRLQ